MLILGSSSLLFRLQLLLPGKLHGRDGRYWKYGSLKEKQVPHNTTTKNDKNDVTDASRWCFSEDGNMIGLSVAARSGFTLWGTIRHLVKYYLIVSSTGMALNSSQAFAGFTTRKLHQALGTKKSTWRDFLIFLKSIMGLHNSNLCRVRVAGPLLLCLMLLDICRCGHAGSRSVIRSDGWCDRRILTRYCSLLGYGSRRLLQRPTFVKRCWLSGWSLKMLAFRILYRST